jgi:hypothetical protein
VLSAISLKFCPLLFSIGMFAAQSNESRVSTLFAGLESRDAPGAAVLVLRDGLNPDFQGPWVVPAHQGLQEYAAI